MHDSSSNVASSFSGPVELSAKRLHELAVQAFRVGNRGRLSLCESLRVLDETRLYFELGFPSLAAYAGSFFQLRRAEAFEYVRVARALVQLTELREAFGQGRMGWSALKAITRVATVGTQKAWFDFVREHGVERTVAEARDALERGRDAPRDSAFGLPNLDQVLVLRFSRSDMEKVRAWIDNAAAQVAESTGAETVTLQQSVLFLCEKDAVTGTSKSPRAQLVYQRCPDCRKARVGTREGFVEVSSDEFERYEGCAEQAVIDGPTGPRLRRQILAREAGRCANPRCHHQADHCHHIVFRSRGGKTDLANEVAVCTTCHALIHSGLLQVSGDPNDKLCWRPVGGGGDSDRAAADRLPVLQIVANGTQESASADSVREIDHRLDIGELADGLVRLGVAVGRSRQLVTAAIAALPRSELSEAERTAGGNRFDLGTARRGCRSPPRIVPFFFVRRKGSCPQGPSTG